MTTQSKVTLFIGILFLLLTTLNTVLSAEINPSFQRAEILAGISSVIIMLLAFLSDRKKLQVSQNKFANSQQGLFLSEHLTGTTRYELAWGSQLLLTATPAATILIYWDDEVLLRRGLIRDTKFTPGITCLNAQNQQKLISLGHSKFYPNRLEFDSILENLPAIIIYPLINRGWLILGGSTENCFSKSDQKWIIGWSARLTEELITVN